MEKQKPRRFQVHFEISKRLLIALFLVLASFMFNRFFTSINEDVIGAFIFILVFSLGVLYYYFGLFRRKNVEGTEYFISMFFVFFLTILMFALIYYEPDEDSTNHFFEFGEPHVISFDEAVYFSTTTITTLGYGDITPGGIFRFIAMIEVFMGVLYGSSLLFFLTRELEEKKEI